MGAIKLQEQLIELAKNGQRTGLKLIDAILDEATEGLNIEEVVPEERMALASEMAEIKEVSKQTKFKLSLVK